MTEEGEMCEILKRLFVRISDSKRQRSRLRLVAAERKARRAEMRARCFVIEFRSGSLFKGPNAKNGGTLGQAMRFQQRRHARQYVERHAPWVWINGGCIMPIEHATTAIANWRHR